MSSEPQHSTSLTSRKGLASEHRSFAERSRNERASTTASSSRLSFLLPSSSTGQASISPRFGLPKSSSSTAVTSSDDQYDLPVASPGSRQSQQIKSVRTGKGKETARNSASESLRRVASSSTLNGIDARQAEPSQRSNKAETSAPHREGLPYTRKRLDSTASVVSSVSVRSTATTASHRNPGARLLQQRPVSVYDGSPGPATVTIAGRPADNLSHFTALGHASKIHSEASSSQPRSSRRPLQKKSGGAQGRSGPLAAATDVSEVANRSTQQSAESSQHSSSYGSYCSQQSDGSADSASSSDCASTQSRPRSSAPRRRPQSFLLKPPDEPSNTTIRHLGPQTVVLPATDVTEIDDGSMAKRTLDELEAENASAVPASPSADRNATVRARKAANPVAAASSRRKTWFGLGGGISAGSEDATSNATAANTPIKAGVPASSPDEGAEVDDETRRRTIRQQDVALGAAWGDEPPPPMDEAEAAFRASLGFTSSSSSSARQIHDQTRSKDSSAASDHATDGVEAAAHAASSDMQATLRPTRNASADRAMRAARRVTWFGWRGDVGNDDSAVGARSIEDQARSADTTPAAQTPDLSQKAHATSTQESLDGNTAGEIAASQQQPAAELAESEQAKRPTVSEDQQDEPSFRTIKKRGWLGRQYEVHEQLPPHADSKQLDARVETAAQATTQPGQPGEATPISVTAEVEQQISGPQIDSTQSRLQAQPSILSLRSLWNRTGKLPDAVEVVPSKQTDSDLTPSQSHDSGLSGYDHAVSQATGPQQAQEQAANAGATWRWSLWRGGPSSAQAHEWNEPATARAASIESGDAQIRAAVSAGDPNVEPAPPIAPMDIADGTRRHGSGGTPSVSDSTTSWTYSSYLASWVPTWLYNAQKEAEAAHHAGTATDSPSTSDDATMSSNDPPRTPAEQVKVEALARPDPPLSPPVVDPGKVVLNEATRQGWISYFSSRSANRSKQIEAPVHDDDGLEVMDISDVPIDGNGATRSVRPASSNAVAVAASPRVKDTRRAETSAASSPASRSAGVFSSLTGSRPASVANNDPSRPATPVGAGKDNAKSLGKAALAKATNASAALSVGVGAARKKEAPAASANAPSQDASASPAAKQVQVSSPPVPNLVLPSFEDNFTRAPRAWPPKVGVLERTLSAVNSYLFSKVPDLERMKRPTRYSTFASPADTSAALGANSSGGRNVQRASGTHLAGKAKVTGAGSSLDKGKEDALKEIATSAQALPRAWPTLGHFDRAQARGTTGVGKIVVAGLNGWYLTSIFRSIVGEQTGTSVKFATMQADSVRRHFIDAGLELNPEAITVIALQGEGKVADRVDRLFAELLSRPQWVKDLAEADAIFFSAHSQGAVVATQLLARLIEQRHVHPERSRICLLAMCGIHHGPFAHLRSSITSSYINYFETAAAKELFDFQSSHTAAAAQYTESLRIILDAGVKTVYVGSADDNVVPLYSALNWSNSHPSILRALYIDGQAFPIFDFCTNLLVTCVALRNAGLSDHNLLTLLSASVAGSLYGGTGHSKVYEEKAVYDLATRYLFEVSHPLAEPTLVPGHPGKGKQPNAAGSSSSSSAAQPSGEVAKQRPTLVSDHFEAQRWNPYELPWALRGLFEDKHVRALFAEDLASLLDDYAAWSPDPRNKTLKDLQFRLAPLKSIARPKVEGPSDLDQGHQQGQQAKEQQGDKAGAEQAGNASGGGSGAKAGPSKL